MNKWNFKKVKNIETVEIYASKGKNELITKYFDRINSNFVIKKGVDEDEMNAVIAKLFDWKIASQIDDETGYLILLN